MLIKRTERQARHGWSQGSLAVLCQPSHQGPRSPQLPASVGSRRRWPRAIGALPLASVQKAKAGPPAAGRGGDHPQEHLHALRGRLHGDRGSVQRRVDRPGAELGYCRSIAARTAPRARRCASSCWRAPAEISDEARQRSVDRVSWDQAINEIGDKIMDIREKSGAGLGLLARFGQDDQRRLLSVPQARRVLGHQQHGPSGAHLPFDDRHRRGQYLGLRRDDQQLHRHPQCQDADHHGRQPGRGPSGVAAAPARRRRDATRRTSSSSTRA